MGSFVKEAALEAAELLLATLVLVCLMVLGVSGVRLE